MMIGTSAETPAARLLVDMCFILSSEQRRPRADGGPSADVAPHGPANLRSESNSAVMRPADGYRVPSQRGYNAD